jgi:transcription elongation GreA/GreB family factor
MNKAEMAERVITQLRASFELLEKAARASHAEATHESSRADNKYDTRGLEASYLAHGQAQQAREILEAIQAYEAQPVRAFGPGDPIALTALVRVQINGVRAVYFVGPASGGVEFEYHGEEIMVLTPLSPLGRLLMGKHSGQRWTGKQGGASVSYHILEVL